MRVSFLCAGAGFSFSIMRRLRETYPVKDPRSRQYRGSKGNKNTCIVLMRLNFVVLLDVHSAARLLYLWL